MCIIFASEGIQSRPTLEQLKQGEASNRDGAGVAWIENGKVRFERSHKGLGHKDIHEIIRSNEGPVLVHFRMISSGHGCDELTHPFPLDLDQFDATSGTVDAVFAHNGTVEGDAWRGLLLTSNLALLPPGPWSDSRALAHVMTTNNNRNILDLFSKYNRFAVLTNDGIELWGNWVKMDKGLASSCELRSYANWRGSNNRNWGKSPKQTTLRVDGTTGSIVTPINSTTELSDEQWQEYMRDNWKDGEACEGIEDELESGIPPITVQDALDAVDAVDHFIHAFTQDEWFEATQHWTRSDWRAYIDGKRELKNNATTDATTDNDANRGDDGNE